MESTQINHNYVNHTSAASGSGSSNRVSFIVGDEDGNENTQNHNHNHMNGDTLSHDDEEIKERRDNFDPKPPPSGLDSKSSSYKDMFGLAERRKRLR